MTYMYQAALYCDDCGKEMQQILRKKEKMTHDRFSRDDSEEWPIDVTSLSDESDSPQHCDSMSECPNSERYGDLKVGQFLENQLTEDGIKYVKELHKNNPSELTQMWVDFYGLWEDDDE